MYRRLLLEPVCALRMLVSSIAVGADTGALVQVDGGLALQGPSAIRVRFVGSVEKAYDVVFERRAGEDWIETGRMPDGAWTVCSDWRDSWYDRPTHVRVASVRADEGGVIASGAAHIGAGQWQLDDRYRLEGDFVRIDRTFDFQGPGPASKITLLTRVRMPTGADVRMLVPGSIYNGNPGSTMPGPRRAPQAGQAGIYEEHRLPIPMANVESLAGSSGTRTYGSMLALPSRIAHGHRGDDQWWSLGLEFGDACVDLVSVIGPVATNGRRSTIYGHRNGFDAYDEAYLDLPGPAKGRWFFPQESTRRRPTASSLIQPRRCTRWPAPIRICTPICSSTLSSSCRAGRLRTVRWRVPREAAHWLRTPGKLAPRTTCRNGCCRWRTISDAAKSPACTRCGCGRT